MIMSWGLSEVYVCVYIKIVLTICIQGIYILTEQVVQYDIVLVDTMMYMSWGRVSCNCTYVYNIIIYYINRELARLYITFTVIIIIMTLHCV